MGLAESRHSNSSVITEPTPQDTLELLLEPYKDKTPDVIEDKDHCDCSNCKAIIMQFTECKICASIIQDTSIYACSQCAGIWCGKCEVMKNCPYCRAEAPTAPSTFLKKLIADMNLPCRNWRLGCQEFVTANTRFSHECVCPHNQIECSIHRWCNMIVPSPDLQKHLLTYHKIIAVTKVPFKVLISHFQAQMYRHMLCRSKYKIYYLAHNSIFVVKVSFFNYKIIATVVRKPHQYEVNPIEKAEEKFFRAIVFFKSKNCGHSASWTIKGDKRRLIIYTGRNHNMESDLEGRAHLIINIVPMEDFTANSKLYLRR